MQQRRKYLFVYGTLKRNERNHFLLAGQTFLQVARTQPHYRLFDQGSYPCLVPWDPGLSIEGEVYEVKEEALEQTDLLEGIPTLYDRAMIELQDFEEPVLVYLYQQSVETFPDCGPCWSGSESGLDESEY